MKVLVLEDEPLIAVSLEDVLVRAGHEVIGPFDSATDVLWRARQPDVGLAVIDLDTPGPDIVTLVRRLAQLATPTIVLSYSVARIDRAAGLASAGVSKPFWPADIAIAIDMAIGRGSHSPPESLVVLQGTRRPSGIGR